MSRPLGLTLLALLPLLFGCPPTYPKCDKDEHCKKGEVCVNGQCQQCRADKDCSDGQVCRSGRCEAPGAPCKTDADCPEGVACINNRCAPCKTDNDCGPGRRCNGGTCTKPGACTTDVDCPENHECQDGVCVAPPGMGMTAAAPCDLKPIYFGFDEHVLSSSATAALQQAAACIKGAPNRRVRIEGHCDNRGTEEYNLALGDRRARAVRDYLVRLGVNESQLRTVSKGKLEATGMSSAGRARDRKALFIWE